MKENNTQPLLTRGVRNILPKFSSHCAKNGVEYELQGCCWPFASLSPHHLACCPVHSRCLASDCYRDECMFLFFNSFPLRLSPKSLGYHKKAFVDPNFVKISRLTFCQSLLVLHSSSMPNQQRYLSV